MPFEFEAALSAAQNIDKFYKHLESTDAEFAAVLKKNLPPILPLPDAPAQKKTVRQKFNETIIKHLDQPKDSTIK